jgi:RNA polymerase sigma factor (sigma-70 family)
MTGNEQKQIVKWIKIVVLRTLKEKNLTRLDVDSLISAGMLGYSQARTRFDPSRNVKFKTFAEYRIKGAVLDEVRKMIGDERAKNPRARRVEGFDYEMISDESQSSCHTESMIDMTRMLDDCNLMTRDLEIIHCRLEGYSIRELSVKFNFSESRASQVLLRIKKAIHVKYSEELGVKFNLITVICPMCNEESLVSDKSKEFRCDHCDTLLERKDGIVEIRLEEVLEDEHEKIEP